MAKSATPPVNAQQAVTIASGYIQHMYPKGAFDILLEEIELNSKADAWEVTVSFKRSPIDKAPSTSAGALAALVGTSQQRLYKVVQVDRLTGEVRSMKIRQVQK